jgi:hypothetical protein
LKVTSNFSGASSFRLAASSNDGFAVISHSPKEPCLHGSYDFYQKMEMRFCWGGRAERDCHLSLSNHRKLRFHCDVNAEG